MSDDGGGGDDGDKAFYGMIEAQASADALAAKLNARGSGTRSTVSLSIGALDGMDRAGSWGAPHRVSSLRVDANLLDRRTMNSLGAGDPGGGAGAGGGGPGSGGSGRAGSPSTVAMYRAARAEATRKKAFAAMKYSTLSIYNLSCFPAMRGLLIKEGTGAAILALALKLDDLAIRYQSAKILFNLSCDEDSHAEKVDFVKELVPNVGRLVDGAIDRHQAAQDERRRSQIELDKAKAKKAASAASAAADGGGGGGDDDEPTSGGGFSPGGLRNEKVDKGPSTAEMAQGTVINAAGILFNLAKSAVLGQQEQPQDDDSNGGGVDGNKARGGRAAGRTAGRATGRPDPSPALVLAHAVAAPEVLAVVNKLALPSNGRAVQWLSSAILCRLSCVEALGEQLVEGVRALELRD